MAPNVQSGGVALLVDARVDATARVGGIALLVDARVDATAWVGGIALLVDAIPSTATPTAKMMIHYKRLRQ